MGNWGGGCGYYMGGGGVLCVLYVGGGVCVCAADLVWLQIAAWHFKII